MVRPPELVVTEKPRSAGAFFRCGSLACRTFDDPVCVLFCTFGGPVLAASTFQATNLER
jgi:hypothetical protein